MRYSELVGSLVQSALFATESDAEQALVAGLRRLGSVLPQRLVRALEDALPEECAEPLSAGSQEPAETVAELGSADRQSATLERMQEVYGSLRPLLSPELVHQLVRELPPELAQAFEEPTMYEAPPRRDPHANTLAEGRPGATHPLSESAPGSTHPLSTSQRRAAQQGSVAANNPHADTKLSSARGFTQEREGETLAEGRPRTEKGRL